MDRLTTSKPTPTPEGGSSARTSLHPRCRRRSIARSPGPSKQSAVKLLLLPHQQTGQQTPVTTSIRRHRPTGTKAEAAALGPYQALIENWPRLSREEQLRFLNHIGAALVENHAAVADDLAIPDYLPRAAP